MIMGSGSSSSDKYILRTTDMPGIINIHSPHTSSDSFISSTNSSSRPSPLKAAKSAKIFDSSGNNESSSSIIGSSSSIASPPLLRRNSSSSSFGLPSDLKIANSPVAPWILKNANLSACKSDDFDLGRVIGTGLMGTVRIAKLKGKSSYVAIKSIQKDYIQRHKDERHVANEEQILQALKATPFCVRLFGKFDDSSSINFVMELVAGGELFRRLSRKESFAPQVAKFYAHEVFSALYHMHSLGFVYRDLKPENIMLDEEGHCKLVDFGFSRRVELSEMMRTVCGTPAYLSPEQLNQKFTNGYTRIVDFWSLGVLIYELLTGLTPFCKNNSETPYEIYLRILNAKIYYPRKVDADSKDLVSHLCHADIAQRLTDLEMIKTHKYFTMDFDAVRRRKLVPPYVPKFKEAGDAHHFEEYRGW